MGIAWMANKVGLWVLGAREELVFGLARTIFGLLFGPPQNGKANANVWCKSPSRRELAARLCFGSNGRRIS